jgi:hypothetical protein
MTTETKDPLSELRKAIQEDGQELSSEGGPYGTRWGRNLRGKEGARQLRRVATLVNRLNETDGWDDWQEGDPASRLAELVDDTVRAEQFWKDATNGCVDYREPEFVTGFMVAAAEVYDAAVCGTVN